MHLAEITTSHVIFASIICLQKIIFHLNQFLLQRMGGKVISKVELLWCFYSKCIVVSKIDEYLMKIEDPSNLN